MEQKWIDKLKNFEAQPPAGLWDRLDSALDGMEQASFARKLQDFEATPPPAAWDKIARQLDAAAAPAAAPVVELKRRRSFAPYIAAAAIIGILLVGAAVLFNRPFETVKDNTLAQSDTPVRRQVPTASDTPVAETPVAAPGSIAATPDVVPATRTAAEVHVPTVHRNLPSTQNTARTTAANDAAIASAGNHPHHVDDERYLVRAYNDGSVVRFSKKVSPVVDCAENSSGFTQSLCRVSIGAVQDKVASALTTDFGSLIERLQDLEKASR
ncbi:MAG: hypothetical protein EOO15_03240 [Chitinophagaceae bacterium]|nr:MAG: hypothetical protein EOO15_03240 [Chitinophagaceae bacterium]